MEEQRQRQEDEQRRAIAESDAPAATAAATAGPESAGSGEEAMLQRALALSTETPVKIIKTSTICFYFLLRNCLTNCFRKSMMACPISLT